MPREQLKKELSALYQEMEKLDGITDDRRQQIEDVARAVGAVSNGAHPGEALVAEIEERVMVFDSEHPQLSAVLRRLVSALSAIGA